MVLGGALGNILDRVRLGYVVDFADLHFGEFRPFLVFNVADAAISIGVLILLLRAFLLRDNSSKDPGRQKERMNMRKALILPHRAGGRPRLVRLLGRRSTPPDEFAVARNAPLVIPPDYLA